MSAPTLTSVPPTLATGPPTLNPPTMALSNVQKQVVFIVVLDTTSQCFPYYPALRNFLIETIRWESLDFFIKNTISNF
jgi:hypothetical protein